MPGARDAVEESLPYAVTEKSNYSISASIFASAGKPCRTNGVFRST